jgi:hypothetical protein
MDSIRLEQTSYRQAASVGTSVSLLTDGKARVACFGVSVRVRAVNSGARVCVCFVSETEVIYGTVIVIDSVEEAMDSKFVI